jgi:hypothetical protein
VILSPPPFSLETRISLDRIGEIMRAVLTELKAAGGAPARPSAHGSRPGQL